MPASLIPPPLWFRRRVRLVSAPFETEWNLARAYNLAASVATGARLLKVDSDTYLQPTFLRMHPLHSPDIFYAGDWRLAPDENAWHLNGVVLLRREHFEGVAGYDERMRRCEHPPAGTGAVHS